MKVENDTLTRNLQLSTAATRFALYTRGTTRSAPSALGARRGLKLERRARTHRALPRTQGTEGTERKGLYTRERLKKY